MSTDVRNFYKDNNWPEVLNLPGKSLNKKFNLLDVASYCKERALISNAGASLEAVCAAILGKQLIKDKSIRNGDWEVLELSPEQKKYAAEDVLVCLEILRLASAFRPFNNKSDLAVLKEGVLSCYRLTRPTKLLQQSKDKFEIPCGIFLHLLQYCPLILCWTDF
jgi:hypothetical protein